MTIGFLIKYSLVTYSKHLTTLYNLLAPQIIFKGLLYILVFISLNIMFMWAYTTIQHLLRKKLDMYLDLGPNTMIYFSNMGCLNSQ